MNNLFDYLIEPYKSYEVWQVFLEVIAAFFGIASVFFSLKRNIWVYPTGIISTILYIYLLYNWGLYGETLINLYYTVMSIYGWYLWRKKTEDDSIHVLVEWATKKDYIKAAFLFVASFVFILTIYYFRPIIQNNYDTAYIKHLRLNFRPVDYVDATTTAIFFIGMWFMAKRKIDNWIFWIIGDALAIGLFIYKEFAITAIQYFVFVIIAIRAYFEWKKQWNSYRR